MLDQIKEMLAKTLKIDTSAITEESRIIEDLGADSLDFVDLLLIIEEKTGVVISDEDAVGLKTVGDVASFLEAAV